MEEQNMMKTSCKNCVFAHYSQEDIQDGCTLQRPQKLGVDSMDDNNYLLSRICNAHRPGDWTSLLSFNEAMNPEATVLKELEPRMGFFIRLRTEEENAMDGFALTLKSICSMTGKPPAYVVAITDKVEYNEELWTQFLIHFGELNENTKYHVLQISETPENIHSIVDEAFNHAENSWIMNTSSGCIVRPETASQIHKITNIDMKQMILVKPYDGYNGMIFPAYLFKFLNGNKVKVFTDEMVDGRGFLEKVEAAAERSSANTLYSWEEFYAA
jgi:hypothetical protein